jgi:hypothetical protein
LGFTRISAASSSTVSIEGSDATSISRREVAWFAVSIDSAESGNETAARRVACFTSLLREARDGVRTKSTARG